MLKFIRTCVSVLLAAASAVPGTLAVYAAGDGGSDMPENTAYYDFSSSGGQHLVTAAMGDGSSPNIVTRGGREGWEISNANDTTESATINCGVDRAFAYGVNDGSTFEIEIDYYDADRAVFSLVYSAQDRSDRFAGSVMTDGVGTKDTVNDIGQWKTAVFRLQDAKFDDSLDSADFKISANILNSNHGISSSTPNGYGSYYSSYYPDTYGRVSTLDPIVIGAVRIKKLDTKNPFDIKVTTDSTSNTLFDEESAKFNYNMQNKTARDFSLNAEYTVTDQDGREVLTKTDTVSIAANEAKEFSVDLGQVPYGLFTLTSSFTADGVENQTKTEFSHSREAEVLNERVGTNVHFEGSDSYKNDENKIMELVKKAGIASVRDSMRWADIETVKGKYEIPEMTRRGMDLAEELGIEYFPIITGDNPNVYGEASQPPKDEATFEAYSKFAEFVAKEFSGIATAAETWNEYNIHYPQHTAEEMTSMIKATYDGVKAANPDMKVIGIDDAGLSLSDMRKLFEAGALNYMDGISYHPYYHSRGPETSGVFSNGLAVQNLLAEFGKPETEIWITENGWPTWLGNPISETDQAVYHVTTILENAAWQIFDRYYFYEFANSGIQPEYMESFFGMTKSVYDEVPYAARPSYVGVCNVNYQLGNTEFKDALGGLSMTANEFVYRFTRQNGDGKGSEMIAIWTRGDYTELGLNLGCDSVTMYDFYGNESTLYGIGGKYSIAATDVPVYLVGDFSSFEECTPPIKASSVKLGGATEDTVEQTVTMQQSEGAYIVPEGSSYFDCPEKTEFADGSALFVVNTPKERFFNKCAQYRIEKDGKIYYHGNLKIESVETVTVNVDHRVSGADVNRWNLTVDITNNRNSTSVSGRIKFNEPQELVGQMPTIYVNDLEPQETRSYTMFMPEVVTKEMRDFSMDTILDTGETFNITNKMFFTVVPYAGDVRPVIDGVVSPGEYSNDTWLSIKGGEHGENVMILESGTSWKGDSDLSGKATMKYDDDNLYMFIEVTDNTFKNDNSDSMSWNGDSIQLGIAGEGVASGGNYCELTIALTPNGPEIYRNLSNNSKTVGAVDTMELQIVRDGTKTRYELAMPWEEILPDGAEPKSGYRPRFAILINEDDGLGRNSYLEYSQVLGAIGTAKNVGYFTDMYLTD